MGRTIRYWGIVLKEIRKSLLGFVKEELLRAILLLGVYAALSVYSGSRLIELNFIKDLLVEINADFRLSIIVIIVFALSVLVTGFFLVPPRLYEQLGGFIERPIILSPEPHPEFKSMGRSNYWRALSVQNISPHDVTECMLSLVSVKNTETGESILRREEDLRWSNRITESDPEQSKTVPARFALICNLAGWVLDATDGLTLERLTNAASFSLAFGPIQRIPVGSYKCIVRIRGKWKDYRINYTEQVYLKFDGRRLLLDSEWLEG